MHMFKTNIKWWYGHHDREMWVKKKIQMEILNQKIKLENSMDPFNNMLSTTEKRANELKYR
jgi:hypothetical protein